MVTHKGSSYAGEHKPIIERETWDAVQRQLNTNAVARRSGTNSKNPSLLTGLLYDDQGKRLKPSHANKSGRRYRYYVSAESTDKAADDGARWRLPAGALEEAVLKSLAEFLDNQSLLTKGIAPPENGIKDLLDYAARLSATLKTSAPTEQRTIIIGLVNRITVEAQYIRVVLNTKNFRPGLNEDLVMGTLTREPHPDSEEYCLEVPISFRRRGAEMRLLLTNGNEQSNIQDEPLIKAVAQGHHWFKQLETGTHQSVRELVQHHRVNQADVSRVLPLGILAPDIIEAILAGKQPTELTASRLKRIRDLPLSWAEQRRYLGFA